MLLSGLLFNLPMYLTNVWYSGYLPFNANKLFDRHGKYFQVTQLVDDRGNLDIEKYHKFGVNPLRSGLMFSSAILRNGELRCEVRNILCLLHRVRHALYIVS